MKVVRAHNVVVRSLVGGGVMFRPGRDINYLLVSHFGCIVAISIVLIGII